MTKILVGLIGANIMKSLSPALYADAFAAAGISGFYHLMDVEQLPGRDLPQLLDAAKVAGFVGTNVTFPFKQDVLVLLDKIDREAGQIGAVNTVTIAPNGRTVGYNTDCRGWRLNFEEGLGRASAQDATAVLVGAGGAGRAVAVALMELGVASLVLYDRDTGKSVSLKADLAAQYEPSRCRIATDLEREVVAADGVVNATPIGMLGFPGNPVPTSGLRANQWASDVIYTPIETAFIKAAAAKGCRILTGGGMCVHQAAESFRLFVGVEPDVERMHRTFAKALALRDKTMAEMT
jgi:shikimate dehydrogenase